MAYRRANPVYDTATFEALADLARLAGLRLVYVRDILDVVRERKDPLESCNGFDWDEANARKNWETHRVTPEEAEDVFFNLDYAHGGPSERRPRLVDVIQN